MSVASHVSSILAIVVVMIINYLVWFKGLIDYIYDKWWIPEFLKVPKEDNIIGTKIIGLATLLFLIGFYIWEILAS